MKKLLVIALCCIAVAFTSCKKEKANQRFIGTYEGTITMNATFDATLGLDPITQEEKTLLNIVAGENDNEIVATLSAPNSTIPAIPDSYELKGTCDGNKLTFNEITIDAQYEQLPVKLTFNSEATLQGTTLQIAGNGALRTEMLGQQINIATVTLKGGLNKK